MEETANHSNNGDVKKDDAPQLSALLKEMKEGLDSIRSKIQSLTVKVKQDEYPTAEGFSYLEAKNLLLLNYCQSLVYYLLRKAKGLSIEGHPVVRSIVEIRLFLEKIRPIDKKQQYQIQKLTKASENVKGNVIPNEEPVAPNKSEDLSKYRPNPDMLVSKLDNQSQDGDAVYRPVKIAPTSMELDKTSKQERNALRREKEILRQAKQSDYIRSLMNDMEDRPEEVRDFMGTSREVEKHVAKMEDRARQEEELFTRVPLSKMERKRDKYLKKSRNGLQGLTESFFDEIKTLPFGDKSGEEMVGSSNNGSRKGGLKKRKACNLYLPSKTQLSCYLSYGSCFIFVCSSSIASEWDLTMLLPIPPLLPVLPEQCCCLFIRHMFL
ncbi:neuroguidin-like isoform X1 [Neltuma alba]|uniref:neuroguidin-like isoform X1 n=1 Tax=Neltuma alba TaxID=207710 RepID=UPI0010A5417F|nr:neuroguidin-like isoform X1 [Prosopis alba]XP_028755384.1 neuroguidin-like isoform X1 [Prosopis alba]